ncbi:MAG: hypothetical protein ABF695_03635 [Liquorilactobacillus ghanensis]|uniref:hypothetical protein n=1 Tax=Liquorilactobacillus ghanensis TaxID=399370 RepID=UPI0039EC598A
MHIKSTPNHTLDNGNEIELEYEIIIDEIFHKIVTVPEGVPSSTVNDYNELTGETVQFAKATLISVIVVGGLYITLATAGTTAAEVSSSIAVLVKIIVSY